MQEIKRNKKCNLFLLKLFTHTIVCVIFISEGNNKNKLQRRMIIMTNFNNEMLTWENAFAQYVKGLEEKNVEMIDSALVIMNTIDAELTAIIWSEDMLVVREWRMLNRQVEELTFEGVTRFKKVEAAQLFLTYVTDLGIKAKVKSEWGKWFTVRLV